VVWPSETSTTTWSSETHATHYWPSQASGGDATTESEMSPAQQAFYTSYLNGLFVTLGMPEIAACFTPDGNGEQQIWSSFPQDMAGASMYQASPE
jgi:hypothetical protein